ncbi:MAG: TAXI family TRAP transporter solute-binding subunit [Kiloniellaceae bacterium]
MKAVPIRILAAAVLMTGVLAGTALGTEVKLPSTLAWTAYNTGTTGYNQSVAIGKALKDKYGVSLRVVPGKNDISRLTPVKAGKVGYSANGIATFFASEGVFQFADPNWGPMPIRMLMSASGSSNLSVATAKDAGVKTFADLKGKRVAWVRGGDALNVGVEAMLACGGLSWDDVTKVEFPGYIASWEGMVNDQVDAAFASTMSGPTKKLEASPRGIFWPPVPHADKKCWEGIAKTAPYFVPNIGTRGTGLSKDNPHEGARYPYPILMTLEGQDKDEVYSLTRALVEEYGSYSAAEPAAKGWALNKQIFKWVVPYHEGAIAYFKEIGKWTEDAQAHNDSLIERQKVLANAWAGMDKSLDAESFKAKWMEVRAAALEKAGFDPIWR